MLALLLVAVALGLSNFAAAIGIGLGGVDRRSRLRVGVIFGGFEAALPVLGLLLGRRVSGSVGANTHWVGAGLLILTGSYSLISAARGDDHRSAARGAVQVEPIGRLLITGLALSVDNLVVGFALGTYRVNLAVAASVIGTISVGLSLIGLEVGNALGSWVGKQGELLGGFVLIVVGLALGVGVI